METIQGTLASVQYHENSFMIGSLQDGRCVKGKILAPQVGLDYVFEGRWTESPQWGKAFFFDHYQPFYPKTNEGIRLYLERNARWVGPEISKKIVAAYGNESLEILKTDPARVAKEISGITPDRATEISENLKRLQNNEALEISLNELFKGLPISGRARQQVIELWQADAPAKIRENPYELIEKVRGIGFLLADEIAKRVGFEMDGHPRIQAGVLYVLNEAANRHGHTYLPSGDLLHKAHEILRLGEEKIKEALPQMEKDDQILIEDDRIFLPKLYEQETAVAQQLKSIREGR